MAQKKVQYVRFSDEAQVKLGSLSGTLNRPKSEIVRALVETQLGLNDPVLAAVAEVVKKAVDATQPVAA
jgi:predicted DNA-binding protein